MKDVKTTKRIITHSKEASVLSNVKVRIKSRRKSFNTTMYSYCLLGMFVFFFGGYVLSMVGVSILAINERNYTYQTEKVLARINESYKDKIQTDNLATANFYINTDHIQHIYTSNEDTGLALGR